MGKSAAWCLALLAILLATPAAADPTPAEIAKTLAPGGKLRAAINLGNPVLAQRDAAGGPTRGISVDISRELARRLGLDVDLVVFDAAGRVADAAKTGAWDIAFLAIDPDRATEIAFTPPYVVIEGTYLVPATSRLRTIEDVDQVGVRVAVGAKSAYDLYLTRALKRAEIVRAPTSPSVIDLFLRENLEVAAGVKQQLIVFAASRPELRVMEGRFMAIEQAVGTPKNREAALPYLRAFVEDLKRSGFVAERLAASNQTDAAVAPPAGP
jgi:polar amino acid transport system substrate-binding protein